MYAHRFRRTNAFSATTGRRCSSHACLYAQIKITFCCDKWRRCAAARPDGAAPGAPLQSAEASRKSPPCRDPRPALLQLEAAHGQRSSIMSPSQHPPRSPSTHPHPLHVPSSLVSPILLLFFLLLLLLVYFAVPIYFGSILPPPHSTITTPWGEVFPTKSAKCTLLAQRKNLSLN